MQKITDITLQPLPYDSAFVQVRRMYYTQEGTPKTWDLALVHDSVAILLYHTEKEAFILVKQFRPPVWLKNNDGYTYELCAGILDKNKSEQETAQEEILEECGYNVPLEAIERVTGFYTSVGFAGSRQSLFFALVDESMRLHNGGGVEHELIEIVELPLSQAKEMMFDETKPKTPGLLFAFSWFFSR